jgi:hypothetical protein
MRQFDRLRIGLTILVTIAIWSLLGWQHFHEGVPSHYLLQDPDLPLISNWWGGLLLPGLTWGLLSLSRRRVKDAKPPRTGPVITGLLAALAFGASMTITFFTGHESITGYLFFGLLPLALILPVHRPECLLGFVLGMTPGFGAVLPTLFGGVMALAAFLIHRLIGTPLMRLAGFRQAARSNEQTGGA